MKKLVLTAFTAAVLASSLFAANLSECDNFYKIKNYTKSIGKLNQNTVQGRANISMLIGKSNSFSKFVTKNFGDLDVIKLQRYNIPASANLSYVTLYKNHHNFIKFLEKKGDRALQEYFLFTNARMKSLLEIYRKKHHDNNIIEFSIFKNLENLTLKNTYNVFESDVFIMFVLFNRDYQLKQVFSTEHSIDRDRTLKSFFRLIASKKYDAAYKLMIDNPQRGYKNESWYKIVDRICYSLALDEQLKLLEKK